MTTARPILFSGPMVCALLEGRKTQTRRLAKFVARDGCNLNFSGITADQLTPSTWALVSRGAGGCWNERTHPWKCPYGIPGDLLWVREAAHYGPDRVAYSASNPPLSKGENVDGWGPRRPGIHMPRWASRLTLEITSVRVERLQDITEKDAHAEGCAKLVMDDDGKFYESEEGTYRTGYAGLWDHINGSGSWDANPWIVALTFTVHRANVDSVIAQRQALEPAK